MHDLEEPGPRGSGSTRSFLPRVAKNPERVAATAARIQDSAAVLLRMDHEPARSRRAPTRAACARRSRRSTRGSARRAQVARRGGRLRAATHEVRLEAAVEVDGLVGDPDLLERVLANLVDNALRHTPTEGTITVAVVGVSDGGGVELRVRDTGPGVPENQRATVFERFTRGAEFATPSNRGLGLAFCKVAVEAHGGTIVVEDAPRPGPTSASAWPPPPPGKPA